MNHRFVSFFSFVLALMVLFTGCSRREELDPGNEPESEQFIPTAAPTAAPPLTKNYVGEYEQDPMYQKLLSISSCRNPDDMASILSELYGSEIYLVTLIAEEKTNETGGKYFRYADPYETFLCQGIGLYNPAVSKVPIEEDTYLFLENFNEVPIFMMTADSRFIVSSYEIKNYEDGSTIHQISGFELFDLFFMAHGYIEETDEDKAFLRNAAYAIEEYAEFEENVYYHLLNSENPSEEKTPEPTPNSPSIQTSNTPYTLPLAGTEPIFAGPGCEYGYIQDVGQDGVYTIVEEAWDSAGDLWGRLKSGVGWVNLRDFYF